MKWTTKPSVKVGEKRIVKRFAFFPTNIDKFKSESKNQRQWIWLEWYLEEQERVIVNIIEGPEMEEWKAIGRELLI